MSGKQVTLANLCLRADQPTTVTFQELYTWVIWQFPRKIGQGGLCGAVHPPVANHGWLPAIIHRQKKQVHVYAHLGTYFSTPEAALDHLHQNGEV